MWSRLHLIINLKYLLNKLTKQDLNIYKEIEQCISDNKSNNQDLLLNTSNLNCTTPKTTHQSVSSSSVTHQTQQKCTIKETN